MIMNAREINEDTSDWNNR